MKNFRVGLLVIALSSLPQWSGAVMAAGGNKAVDDSRTGNLHLVANSAQDALRSIRFTTSSRFIVMPVFDKSGSTSQFGSAGGTTSVTNEFATEVLNDAIRDAGATTISWFRVNSEMNKKFGQTGLNRSDLTNDSFIPELIQVGKQMGARYIIRPVVLNITDSTSTETSLNPAGLIPYVGIFAGSTRSKTRASSTVTLKVDIISTIEEDIIGSRTFEGAVRDEKTSSGYNWSASVSSSSGGMSAMTRGAMYDAIFKSVDFIKSRVN